MDFLISQALAQAILDYLVERPYREVAGLVAAVQQLPPIETVRPARRPAEAEG